MFIFLLSGLFCCLGFSGVIFFLLFGQGRVYFFFAVWAGVRAPPKQKKKHAPGPHCKKNTPPAQTAKKSHAPGPNSKKKKKKRLPTKQQKQKTPTAQTAKKNNTHTRPNSKNNNTLGRGGACFFAVWAVGVSFLFLFGRGALFFLTVWAGGMLFVAVWAGGVFVFAVWAGDGSSLTYRSAWLVFKRPNNKKDQTAKKNTGSLGSHYFGKLPYIYIYIMSTVPQSADKVVLSTIQEPTI